MAATGLFAVIKSIDLGRGLVEVDANHPLAGEDLYLDVQIVELTKGSTLQVATFAGGSFWELELTFQRVDGVMSTQVCAGAAWGWRGGQIGWLDKKLRITKMMCNRHTRLSCTALSDWDPAPAPQVGYTQGRKERPSYPDVCSGKTGHVEAVKLCFDPSKVSYIELLEVFFATGTYDASCLRLCPRASSALCTSFACACVQAAAGTRPCLRS